MTVGIYAIRKIYSTDCYVGQSVNCEKRWNGHLKDLRVGKHHAGHLQNAFSKYGEAAFSFEMMEVIQDRTSLTPAEQRWMDQLKPGYNSAPRAASNLGCRRSPEWCARKSAIEKARWATDPSVRARMSREGKPGPWTGRPIPPEIRAKIAAAKRGRPSGKKGWKAPLETRLRMSAARKGCFSPNKGKTSPYKGIPRSAEVRAKISDGQRGRKMNDKQRAALLKANLGRPGPYKGQKRPEWVRGQISAALKGKPWSEARRLAQANVRRRSPNEIQEARACILP